jgi:hypothetical protein
MESTRNLVSCTKLIKLSKQVSQARYQRSFFQGKECEDKFVKLMEARGHVVTPATRSENIFKHIDFYVGDFGVDVKGNRHLDCIWLELKNVRGNNGWLRGEAVYIAFDIVELSSFAIFKRQDLLEFVLENVTEESQNKNDFMKYYSRAAWGKDDLLVKVRFDHLKNLTYQLIGY